MGRQLGFAPAKSASRPQRKEVLREGRRGMQFLRSDCVEKQIRRSERNALENSAGYQGAVLAKGASAGARRFIPLVRHSSSQSITGQAM